MSYKWITTDKLVRRLADDANIPADEGNRDWRTVLAWIAAGNTIQAADPPPPAPPPTADEIEREALRAKLTPADLDAAKARLLAERSR